MSSKYLSQNIQQDNIALRVNDITSNGVIYVDDIEFVHSSSKLNLGLSGNIETSSVGGSQIALSAGQKVSFHGQTPSSQHSSTGEVTGFTAGSGTSSNVDSTYTGNVGATAYTVSDIVKALKNKGLLAE